MLIPARKKGAPRWQRAKPRYECMELGGRTVLRWR
ncbi:hypothetical protein E1A91_A07G197000v1 [Gossypium mustelinum]|uniref:Uncharacterized protein n=1 Tax=Gossypium mustelinum TaxID=34275 RepID=A0A5D2YN53_GOSMU|nr:hypothetical protein E1A91_A07G197000v1 [Gossypium mustelinum]